jgi:hypothetical protein
VERVIEEDARSPEEREEAIRILKRGETRDALRRLLSTRRPVGKRAFASAILFLAHHAIADPLPTSPRRGRPFRSFHEIACYAFLDGLFRKHVFRPCGEAVRLLLSAAFGYQNWDLVKLSEEAEERIGRPRKRIRA